MCQRSDLFRPSLIKIMATHLVARGSVLPKAREILALAIPFQPTPSCTVTTQPATLICLVPKINASISASITCRLRSAAARSRDMP